MQHQFKNIDIIHLFDPYDIKICNSSIISKLIQQKPIIEIELHRSSSKRFRLHLGAWFSQSNILPRTTICQLELNPQSNMKDNDCFMIDGL